jgi:FkbM family methyltransferase
VSSRGVSGTGAVRPTRIRDIVTLASRLRYVRWRLLEGKRPLTVKLRSGLKIILRPPPALDLTTAHDIFVSEIYDAAGESGASRDSLIVDLGANVGYSCLYFAGRFPGSRLLAFEPHPTFARFFKRNMALNGLESRVRLIPAAAHTTNGMAALTDAEDSSSLVELSEAGAIPVQTVDFFEAVGAQPISLLKMDVEGAEIPLLADPRFGTLDVRMILLEWHDPSGSGSSKGSCWQRLTALGFAVKAGKQDGVNTGLITALRV